MQFEDADFDQPSRQAVAMRMKVLEDVAEAPLAGETMQRKGWIGMLTTGPFALRIEKMSGAKGVATSCAVDGPVPDTQAFYEMVIKKLRLASASTIRSSKARTAIIGTITRATA